FPIGCNTSCWRNKYTASSLLIPSTVSHSPTIYAGVFNSSLNFTFCCSLANTVTPGNDSPEKVSDAASTTGIAFFLKPFLFNKITSFYFEFTFYYSGLLDYSQLGYMKGDINKV